MARTSTTTAVGRTHWHPGGYATDDVDTSMHLRHSRANGFSVLSFVLGTLAAYQAFKFDRDNLEPDLERREITIDLLRVIQEIYLERFAELIEQARSPCSQPRSNFVSMVSCRNFTNKKTSLKSHFY